MMLRCDSASRRNNVETCEIKRNKFCWVPMEAWKPIFPQEVCTKCKKQNSNGVNVIPYAKWLPLKDIEMLELIKEFQPGACQQARLQKRKGRRNGAVIRILKKLGMMISGTYDDNLYKIMKEIGI